MKSLPVPISKIAPPRMPAVFPRERLFCLMDEALERPVVWVSAPGGSGKTTFVASYLEGRKLPALWYLVDKGDEDVATLYYYLTMAIQQYKPRNRASLPRLTAEKTVDPLLFARRFFEVFCSRLPTPSILVFDDYQEVAEDFLFHEVLRTGLLTLPFGIKVIIISRNSTPPVMTRLIANNRMASIDWEALRLEPAETRAIAELTCGSVMSDEHLWNLHEKSHGWVAGVVLMVKGKKYGEVAIPTSLAITPEEIFDYFAWEVFNRLDPMHREFLLRTALFPTFSPKMAAGIFCDASAQQLPSDLNRNNYFMEKRTGNENLYRYHPLFREFLLKRGESTFPAEQLYALRQQAFDILSDNGYIEDAATLAVSGKNWPGLTRLIGDHARRFIEQGRTETVLNWLSGIPEDIFAAHAGLQFWKGTCRAASHPESAQFHLTRSFDLFRENGDRSGMLMSWSGVSDLFLHSGEFAAVENWFLRLQDILAADPAFPSREIEARVTMSAFNLMAFRMSDHPDIEYWHERTYDIVMGQLKFDRNRRIDCAIHLLVYYVWQGIHSRAAIIAEFLHNAAQSAREFDLRAQTAKTGEALYYSLSAQHERCYETVRQAVADSEQNGIHVWTAHILCHGASAAIGAGDWETAGSFLGKIEAIVDESRRLDLGYFHLLMGWKKMCSDDLAGAREHQKLSIELLQGVRFLAAESLSQVNMAEILVGLGNLADARTHLDHAYCLARQLRSDFLRFFCLLVDAQLNFQQGGYPEGDERLREAFYLARTHGFVTTFSWRAPVMARLCARALDRGIESGYVAHLVKVRKLGSYPPDADIGAWPWPVRIHTLGTFVLEIDGKPLRFSGKVQKKPLEMLKLLVALGGAERREGEISDLLWPDADGDTARNSFKVTLRRLRELLGVENVLQIHDGRLMLDRRQCWTDVQALEQLLSAPLPDNGHDDGAEAIRCRRKALSLYRGPFLSEDADKSWAITCRKRLQTRFTSNILALGAIFLANGDHGRAIDCFLKGLDAEPVSEELYQQLMQSYLDAGLRSEAVAAYQRCSKLLLSLLGVAPSPKTTTIYQAALSA